MTNITSDVNREAKRIFDLQKKAYSPAASPSYEERLDRINRIEKLHRENLDEITRTIGKDFGTRHPDWCFTGDIYPGLDHVAHVKKSLKKWMSKEKSSSGIMGLTGQRTYIINEPLGVVGIMAPFNAPVSLTFDPAIEAVAAGNRVMMKLSESTPRTATLIQKLVKKYFAEEEMAVITGEADVSAYFSSLPWDKFFFTGSSEVGKKILAAAAPNLTPAILELGGKSPCVVLDDADVVAAARKIGTVRVTNAGQVCISGDYVLLPENKLETFVDAVISNNIESYPHIINNPEFTSIINERAYDRIVSYIDEARAARCRIIQANPKGEAVPDRASKKIPLTVVINPAKNLMVSKNEIFGPVLSVFTYKELDDAIKEVNRREKPLALYIFGKNQKKIDKVVNETSSGGVTVNDMLLHANAPAMGFGGVGYSGMGRYKGGFTGFQAFTNPKAVYKQGFMKRFTDVFFFPYKNPRTRSMLRSMVGVK